MKKRFEANVAGEFPKTKLREPKLPWKVTTDDLEAIEPPSPLKARAPFLIALLAAIFLASSYFIVNIARENRNMHSRVLNRNREMSSLRQNLDKVSGENASIKENYVQLEKRAKDLSAQKALFTGVIESLTKKNEEIATE